MAKTNSICSISDCIKPAHAKGFCHTHYYRLRKNGDPNAVKFHRRPDGEQLKFYRDVVIPYDGDDCLTWPYSINNMGYGVVWKDGRYHVVSRMVCEDVNGSPLTTKHHAAHSCGNGHLSCVNSRHISWKTAKENAADKLVHGTHGRGERSSSAKLSEVQVREILSLKGKETQRTIADRYGITFQTVSDIHLGKSWAWLSPE